MFLIVVLASRFYGKRTESSWLSWGVCVNLQEQYQIPDNEFLTFDAMRQASQHCIRLGGFRGPGFVYPTVLSVFIPRSRGSRSVEESIGLWLDRVYGFQPMGMPGE